MLTVGWHWIAPQLPNPRSWRVPPRLFTAITTGVAIGLVWLSWLYPPSALAVPGEKSIKGDDFSPLELQMDAVKVSTFVKDIRSPLPPFLIKPQNRSFVTTRKPTFVWRASVDDYQMGYYQLWVDGKILFDKLPLTSTTHRNYTLVFDPTTDEYRLTLKNPSLLDGTHTWKVVAVDTSGNQNPSATWSFVIDTLAPYLIIQQVGNKSVSISASDLNTIPSRPIELLLNEPLITGVGEPNSTITLTILLPGSPPIVYQTTIDSNGNWSFQLPILPREVEVELSFLVEDPAGLITVLNGVKLWILGFELAGGATAPSPTPQPGEPPPASTPLTTIIIKLKDFWPSADWRPEFTKRLAPIKELAYALLQQVATKLPTPLYRWFIQVPTKAEQPGWHWLSWLNPILMSLIPLISSGYLWWLSQLNSPRAVIAIGQALHLWPVWSGFKPVKSGGWVFDSTSNKGVAFATVQLISLEADTVVETVLTDRHGYFPPFSALNHPAEPTYQHYKIAITYHGKSLELVAVAKLWPSQTHSSFVYWHNTYQGGVLSLKADKPAPFWVIPTTAIPPTKRYQVLEWLSGWIDQPWGVLLGDALLTFLILVFYTSTPNALVVLYLCLLSGVKAGKLLERVSLSVVTQTSDQTPLPNCLVFCRPVYDPTLLWIGKSNAQGVVRLILDKPRLLRHSPKDRHYYLRTYTPGACWQKSDRQLEAARLTIGQSPDALALTFKTSAATSSGCLL